MAIIEYWIQLENKPWDTAPRNIDRMSGQTIEEITGQAPVPGKTITSPMTRVSRTVTMNLPVSGDALILRRYKPPKKADRSDAWTIPEDRKVNPWDLNEPDPTDNGTMGTIPGATIEANVGDSVIVHFRNRDTRTDAQGKLLGTHQRAHSLHTHGFVFESRYDGAFPLSPPDPQQPVGPEAPLWALLHLSGYKKGDRVPGPDPSVPTVPNGGTFDYRWETFGWPTTAGVWQYHDHSICDMENIRLGAIGFVVIHNPADPDDVVGDPSIVVQNQPVQERPGGSFNGSPVQRTWFPPPFKIPTLPADLDPFLAAHPSHGHGFHERTEENHANVEPSSGPNQSIEHNEDEPKEVVVIERGDLILELDPELRFIERFSLPFYRPPPRNALYLQLYHEMPGVDVLINGRKFLGNAPTLVGGPNTKMRFGLIGMNNMVFHTFHLHGHRWVIPGPRGDHPGGGNGPNAIQNSPLVQAVSQFEDTKSFGPANSFSFTINEGTFMGGPIGLALGEWHMHCHVLMHMMSDLSGGMMGSLLIVQGGELALGLPSGEPCHTGGAHPGPGTPTAMEVSIVDNAFNPSNVTVSAGQTVTWTHNGSLPHTVTSNPGSFLCSPSSAESFDSGNLNTNDTFEHTFNTPGSFPYHCEIHGCSMAGIVTVV